MATDPSFVYQLAGELYDKAKELRDEDLHEPYLRSTISRSYYAAYLATREELGIDPSTSSSHKSVIDEAKKQNKTRISNQLSQMKQKRELADYEINKSVDERDAARSLQATRYILNNL